MPDAVQTILEKYPQYGYMLQDPELRFLLVAALNPDTGFDAATFTNNLMKTNWWKTHSASQRNFIQQTALDPASAERTVSQKIDQLRNFAYEGGLMLTEPELRWEATLAVGNGWSDQEAKRNLLWVAGTTGRSGQYAGSIGNNAQQVRSLAAQMAIPITDQEVNTVANDIWMGQSTLDMAKTNFAQRAIHAYGMQNPELAQALNEGQTVRQFLDPQIAAVANTLEKSSDQIDLMNPKYAPLLNYTDSTGKLRMMTTSEASIWARSQKEYQYTKGGRDAAWSMVDTLSKALGERK